MSVLVLAATPNDWPAAVRGLFAHAPEPERTSCVARIIGQFESGGLDASGLLVARSGGRVVGAGFAQKLPGNTAAAWPPWAVEEPIADALAEAVANRIRGFDVKVAHAFGRGAERGRFAALERVGFRRVTELTFLSRPIPGLAGLPAFDAAVCPLKFTPVPGPTPAFATALLATYEGTLDCPELNGTRTGDEVLAGYVSGAARGNELPDWFLISRGGEGVGVLMFGPANRTATAELSYVGLIPSLRGLGLGGEILRFALRHAASVGAEWITLSVDTRNLPAIRLYERHAFRSFDVQDVYLWKPE